MAGWSRRFVVRNPATSVLYRTARRKYQFSTLTSPCLAAIYDLEQMVRLVMEKQGASEVLMRALCLSVPYDQAFVLEVHRDVLKSRLRYIPPWPFLFPFRPSKSEYVIMFW